MNFVDGWWVPAKMAAAGSYIGRSRHIASALSHHVGMKRIAVQAGGHIGIWPKTLAETFKGVFTFEADMDNWQCLCLNTRENFVFPIFGALGERNEVGYINVHSKSTGGHHMMVREDWVTQPVPTFALDDALPKDTLADVDAIFLDIEGYELHALRGAMKTIKQSLPTLVIEENGCSKKFGGAPGDIEKMLAPLGYRKVAAYDEDIVLIARQS